MAISICHLKLRCVVGLMRRLSPLTLVALLLLQTLAVGVAVPASAASARGGANDDFRVTVIELGNETIAPNVWVQSNGTTVDYLFEGDSVEISMTIQRGGSSFSSKTTDAMVQIIHPIGYVMETFSWTSGELIGGQGDSASFVWTPSAAHSILDTTTNDLSGGLIVRAMVDKDSNGDDRNENDMLEQTVPIAIMKDLFDGTQAAINSPTFIPGRYPVDGGNAIARGSWVELSGGAVGSNHWGNSEAGNDYPSNAHDRLVNGFFNTQNSCGADGQLDAGLTNAYGIYVCRQVFYASNYISTQFHIQAWGSVSAGDSVMMELWRGSGSQNINESIAFDISSVNPSQAPDQWTNISWDPQVTYLANPYVTNTKVFLGGNSYTMGMVLRSDGSGASDGFHVDDWIQFGIRKVTEYTLGVDCDAPETGYSAPPSDVISMSCEITNNGYSPATIRSKSNITNTTWMDPANPMIRQDAVYINAAGYLTLANDHDTDILIPPIQGGESIDLWVNLTIPPGADVQQLTWSLWFQDASGQNSGEKGRISAPVGVTEQFGVSLTSTVPLLASTIGPGGYDMIPFRLQNSGNRDASFNLATQFSEDGWSSIVTNETGSPVSIPVYVPRGQSVNLMLNVSAADKANPGTVSFNLRATCPSCGALFGNDVLVRNIDVPVFREVSLETDQTDLSGPANGNAVKVYITLYNLGNDDEQYDLSLTQQNWMLGANLAASQTQVLDAWEGDTIIQLNLPMPIGLSPGLYSLSVIATSVDDPTVRASLPMTIDILDTAAVDVSDEDADQSYIPGDPPQTMAFEVRNDGNSVDRFTMSLNLPDGMMGEFTNLFDGMTPEIDTGASYNVSVRFWFTTGTQGQLTMDVIATSVNDPTIDSFGSATYLVGSQNWLKIIPAQKLVIDEADPGDDWSITVTVRNQYTTAQSVSMDLDNGQSSNWVQSRIATNDRNFVLDVEQERTVTVFFEVSETTLRNLGQASLLTNLTLWAQSETVSDAASTTLQLELMETGSSGDGVNAASDESSLGPILLWVGFIVVLAAGVFVIFRILSETEEEDDFGGWGEEGYEGSIEATYGAVAAAPTVPVGDVPGTVPKALPSVPAQAPPQPAPAAAVPTVPAAEATSEVPPIPAAGLPDGWTMDQWSVYGQMWLEQNEQA